MEPAVEMIGVGKSFGRRTLFRGVSLVVHRGGCAALTGRNGVGKTTLLRIAAGLTSPTEGTVHRAADLSIGYVPENLPRLPMTARQFLQHMAAVEGLGEADAAEGQRLIADFSLDDLLDLPMTRLSKGTLQKVAVAQALMRPRDLLILDEPLSGQDEKSREVFIDRVLAMRRSGAAVLLACHEAFLAERLADAAYSLSLDGLTPAVPETACARAVMGFEPDEEMEAPPSVRWWKHGGRLYLSAPVRECDSLIADMLKRGYSLREMRDE